MISTHSPVGLSHYCCCHPVLLSSPPVVVQFLVVKFPQIDVRAHEKRRAPLTFSSREVNPRSTSSFMRRPVTTPFRSSLFADFVQTYLRQSLRYLSRPSRTDTSRILQSILGLTGLSTGPSSWGPRVPGAVWRGICTKIKMLR